MTHLSRFFGTEASLVDHYEQWAKRGAGFLAVYSSAESDATGIAGLLGPHKPMAAHWFMPAFIRHMV
jgi:hypothetical protein